VANGVVYVGSLDNNLYAFYPATGAMLWTATTGNMIGDSSPAMANGVVYVGSYDHRLYAFALNAGNNAAYRRHEQAPSGWSLHPSLKPGTLSVQGHGE
jgi:outer membrane protein assembly factor BamB